MKKTFTFSWTIQAETEEEATTLFNDYIFSYTQEELAETFTVKCTEGIEVLDAKGNKIIINP